MEKSVWYTRKSLDIGGRGGRKERGEGVGGRGRRKGRGVESFTSAMSLFV